MFFCSIINSRVQFSAGRIQGKDSDSGCEFGRCRSQRSLAGNLLTCLQIELNGALYPRPIARVQLVGFNGIKLSQNSMKALRSMTLLDLRQSLPKLFVSRVTGKKRSAERA